MLPQKYEVKLVIDQKQLGCSEFSIAFDFFGDREMTSIVNNFCKETESIATKKLLRLIFQAVTSIFYLKMRKIKVYS